MDKNFNAEELHDIANDTAKVVSNKFVNPGTPEAPLTKREELSNATLKEGTNQLRKKLIK